MTQHTLQNRSDDEILWFQRRSFLQAAASWSALGGINTAWPARSPFAPPLPVAA